MPFPRCLIVSEVGYLMWVVLVSSINIETTCGREIKKKMSVTLWPGTCNATSSRIDLSFTALYNGSSSL